MAYQTAPVRCAAILLLLGAVVLSACGTRPAPRKVSLTNVANLETIQTATQGAGGPSPVRLAIASVLSPQQTVLSYGVLTDYLARKLGQPVEMLQRRTYAETLDLLRSGGADFAFVCTYVYILGHREFGLEILVVPQVGGKTTYQSFIIARSDSGIERFEDLAGRRFAFTDPLSNSGRLYPLARLLDLGQRPEAFFSSILFTYSHDNSIQAVAEGVVDGAAVDSLIYHMWRRAHPDQEGRITVVEESPDYASTPFVARPGISPELKRQFQQILVSMHEDPEGRRTLEQLDIDRLVILPDAAYDGVRALARKVGLY